MLNGMRGFARSKWAWGLLGLLALAMAMGVGIANPFAANTGGAFVQGGPYSFGIRDANRYLDRYITSRRENEGEIIDTKQAAREGITSEIVGLLVQRASALAYADSMEVKASPKAVARIFSDAPRFRDALGQIQISAIDVLAADESYANRKEFEEAQLEGVTVSYIEQAIMGGLSTPDILVTPIVEYVGERRQISYASLGPDSLPAPTDPTSEELQAFYQDNIARFSIPERRTISAIAYSAQDMIDTSEITDEMIRAAYDARIQSYTTGEVRDVTEISSESASDVQTVVDLVKQGKTIDEALSAANVTANRNKVTPDAFEEEAYGNMVFGMPEGEIVGPFQIADEWVGVMVHEIEAGDVTPFEDVADDLRVEMAEQDARRAYNDSSDLFYDFVGAGDEFTTIGEEVTSPVITLAAIDRSGTTVDGHRTTFFNFEPTLLTEAFELEVGDYSSIVETDDLRAVIRVDAITPASEPPLEDIREQVVASYHASQRAELANQVMNDVLAKIDAGETLDDAARDAKLEVSHPADMIPRPMDPRQSNALLEAAFGASEKQTVLVQTQSGPMLVKVEAILPMAEEQRGAAELQVRNLVTQELQSDIQQASIFQIRDNVTVKTNDVAISSYLNSFTDETQ